MGEGRSRTRNISDQSFSANAPGVWKGMHRDKLCHENWQELRGAPKSEKFTCRSKAPQFQNDIGSISVNI